jgi:hypothetical protein
VFATADSIPFVYKKDGSRQVVVLGESNENDVIVEQGLKPGRNYTSRFRKMETGSSCKVMI